MRKGSPGDPFSLNPTISFDDILFLHRAGVFPTKVPLFGMCEVRGEK